MPATYQSAVDALFALGHELASPKPRKFDLGNMRKLAEALGHPERRFQSVLIAGTNGKGSTSATLAAICHAAGIRTGLYTSPHLLSVNERIRIFEPGAAAGETISDAEFAEMYARVLSTSEKLVAAGALAELPSFFETLTAMAFEYFASVGIELAVLEVGMGGRLDATNIVEPCLSVITDISLDHQNYLGNTIAEIAREKCGILRANGTLITLPQHPQANEVIGQVAEEKNVRGVSAAKHVPNVSPGATKFENKFETLPPTAAQLGDFQRSRYMLEVLGEDTLIETPLLGRHQLRNVALAITAAEELNSTGFSITAQQIAEGVRNTRWAGRFHIIPASAGRPEVVLDVAHNPAGAWALRSALSENYPERRITIVFGAMRDKDIREIAQILFPVAERVFATHAESVRAASPEEVRAASGYEVETAPSVREAVERAIVATPRDGLLVVTGSIYVVGEALQQLSAKPAEPRR